jgi:hypothetical protein
MDPVRDYMMSLDMNLLLFSKTEIHKALSKDENDLMKGKEGNEIKFKLFLKIKMRISFSPICCAKWRNGLFSFSFLDKNPVWKKPQSTIIPFSEQSEHTHCPEPSFLV